MCLSYISLMVPLMILFAATMLVSATESSDPGIVRRHFDGEDAVHTNILQQRLRQLQTEKYAGRMKFLLSNRGKGDTKGNAFFQEKVVVQKSAAETEADPTAADNIPQTYWMNVDDTLYGAGRSTPQPTDPNAPPPPPTPLPWNSVNAPLQPLDTRAGALFLSSFQQQPTKAPPPTQNCAECQFIAQCPMIMFEHNISVRGGSCGESMGKWVDPGSTGTDDRVILRWYSKKAAGGLYFGVDSAISGMGSVLFADAKNRIAFKGYYFDLVNCLGVERYTIVEEVIKIDKVGQVASTIQSHDVNTDTVGFFYRFSILSGNTTEVARSNLFRLYADQVNFTEVDSDGQETGKILATAKRTGDWKGDGWHKCMSASSPRGWNINFPQKMSDGTQVATVQDIRVAIAATITLMGYREEGTSPKTGLNATNDWKQFWGMSGAFGAVVLCILLICNCCFVFHWSGLKVKMMQIAFDLEAAFLPKRSMKSRLPPLHPTY